MCNNGNKWNKFCTNTAHTMRKVEKAPTPPKQPSRHKTAENEGLLAPEPLLQENPHCFVLLPIHHANIWRMYKKAEASFWTAEEINPTEDITDRDRLSANECHFVSHVLAFFAASDGIINENLSSNFATKVMAPKA
jgi:ribonucleotide reductase beta subunit family protein with ferritin-like domain